MGLSFIVFIVRVINARIFHMISHTSFLMKVYRGIMFKFFAPNDFKEVPIYINNRNRLTFLKDLIDWLENNGYENYYIIDNDSTYPPLLEYYKKFPKEKIIFLKENVGYWSMWNKLIYLRKPFQFYVYTDSDVVPVEKHNPELVKKLFFALKNVDLSLKAGCALKIDDLPDWYSKKKDVLAHEANYWKNQVSKDIYKVGVDTTFALYLPYWHGVGNWNRHVRVAGDCTIKHQPWYMDDMNLDEENRYYVNNASASTHWTGPPKTKSN